ncbi:plasmid replication initiator TrfA [uncultured Lamprocystis sp.]|uniref:plasmid replication initiator TrfA n=1 Tax=uncultured Lamprocystis sp. TaxID=543132 RepID=UPI0025E22767|nr:plasmid replication initiator TrfA [uncultured Lamprocystis sp.]
MTRDPTTLAQNLADRTRGCAKSPTLPSWPDAKRGTPNSFLRGSLFAAIQGKDRRYLLRELLACQGGISIRFTGIALDQSDLDVFQGAVQLAKGSPLGDVCSFGAREFLRSLERGEGKSDLEWLKDSLSRLAATAIDFEDAKLSNVKGLLSFEHDKITGSYSLWINQDLIRFYRHGWTAVDWVIRQKLRRKPLALWLHGWLSSNATNYPTKVGTIRALSGSTNKQAAGFKRQVCAALEDLVAVGFLNDFSVEGDLVSVSREPSPSQSRRLTVDK